VFQIPAKASQRPVKVRAGGSFGAAKKQGRLREGFAVEVRPFKNASLRGGQSKQGLLELRPQEGIVWWCLQRPWRLVLKGLNKSLAFGGVAVVGCDLPAEDRVKPRGQPGVAAERIDASDRLKKRFLSDVLREVEVNGVSGAGKSQGSLPVGGDKRC
jgi:hypothetical protein